MSQYSQENTFVGVSFSIKLPSSQQLYSQETPIQMFSCEYCDIFKNTHFEEDLRMAASDYPMVISIACCRNLCFHLFPKLFPRNSSFMRSDWSLASGSDENQSDVWKQLFWANRSKHHSCLSDSSEIRTHNHNGWVFFTN